VNELPAGWVATEMGVVADTRLGKMLSKKSKTGTEPRPYLRNKNVQWGRIDVDDLLTMDFDSDELDRFEVIAGDLLVCEGGEIGRAAIWRGQLDWIGYQKALHRVRPLGGVAPEFLLYCFMWLAQSHALEKHVTGSTIRHLPQEDLRRISIPLPPLNEQRRIVDEIEEQLSRLDGADASLVIALKRSSSLRNATLTSWYPDEIPPSWKPSIVGEVGNVDLGRQRSPRYHSGRNMRPYLRVANVFEARIDISDVMEMDFGPTDFEKYRLEIGDILLNEGQSPELVGRPAMFRGELDDVCFTNSLIRFRPCSAVDAEFALLVFRRHLHVRRFMREARITTNIAHLSAGRFKTIEFPVPPLNEQRRIVARVEEQLSAIDALRGAIERAQRRSATLRRAVLEQAFRGKLVPQDPSDEPASMLLERIRAERAAAPPSSRRRRVTA
jgi:type I restriction enzyme, S subunit